MFFIAIGMSIDLSVVLAEPCSSSPSSSASSPSRRDPLCAWPLVGIEEPACTALGLVISQGGEFAFVLFAAGVRAAGHGQHMANL